MTGRVPTAVWRIRPEVVLALAERLGDPTDHYVNGSQTWIEGDGPGGVTLEWRLHPVAGFRRPEGIGAFELWETVTDGLQGGGDPSALAVGSERRPLHSLWDGLECFPAYGDAVEPAVLANAVAEVLGIPPDRTGLVDHGAVGDAWERARGELSIVALLLEQLEP